MNPEPPNTVTSVSKLDWTVMRLSRVRALVPDGGGVRAGYRIGLGLYRGDLSPTELCAWRAAVGGAPLFRNNGIQCQFADGIVRPHFQCARRIACTSTSGVAHAPRKDK